MERVKQTLGGIELLQTLSPGDIEALGRRCTWRRYHADQQIVGHADETNDVFFIVEGQVRVIVYSVSGKAVNYRDLGRGQTFGELSAIDGQPRSANVVALTESLIATMPAATFWEVLGNHPAVAAATLRRLTHLVRSLSDRIFEFSTLAVKNRIHAELLRLARERSSGDHTAVLSPAPTHAEIAARISTHREAVTRELNELSRAGLIERRQGSLIIRDVGRLARMVSEVTSE